MPSAPHLAMTVAMLREAGASVDDTEPGRWAVSPGGLRATRYAIEPDLSSASAFLAAAAVTGGRRAAVGVAGRRRRSPGGCCRNCLSAFGCRCEVTAAG